MFQEYVDTVKMLSQRVAALDQQVADAAGKSVLWPVIEALMALRCVSLGEGNRLKRGHGFVGSR